MKKVLTIAGSDPTGGAGIQVDIKVFSALGVYGLSVVTAVTAQNTEGVRRTFGLPVDWVSAQIDSVVSDIVPNACKTGMLYDSGIVEVVAEKIRSYKLQNLVIDPVIYAKDGMELLSPDGVEALKERLIPLAELITPNVVEAGIISGVKIKEMKDLEKACRRIYDKGCKNVLITGYQWKRSIDILFDGENFVKYEYTRLKGKEIHGTGCVLSAGIAAGLAKGEEVKQAIESAKAVLSNWFKGALGLGKGYKLMNPS